MMQAQSLRVFFAAATHGKEHTWTLTRNLKESWKDGITL
jgi:hypothetical protein